MTKLSNFSKLLISGVIGSVIAIMFGYITIGVHVIQNIGIILVFIGITGVIYGLLKASKVI